MGCWLPLYATKLLWYNHKTEIELLDFTGSKSKDYTQIDIYWLKKSLTLSRTCVPNWTCGGGKGFPCWPKCWRGPMNGRGWLDEPPWLRFIIPWWLWWGGRLGLGGSLGKGPIGPWPIWLKGGPGGPNPMWPWLGSCCWWWRLWLFIGLELWWSNMCCPGNRVDSVRSGSTQDKANNNKDVRLFWGCFSLISRCTAL